MDGGEVICRIFHSTLLFLSYRTLPLVVILRVVLELHDPVLDVGGGGDVGKG